MKPNVSVPRQVNEAKYAAGRAAGSKWVSGLARLGYAAKGVVYLIIGGLAAKLASGQGGAATDQRGARPINDWPWPGAFLFRPGSQAQPDAVRLQACKRLLFQRSRGRTLR